MSRKLLPVGLSIAAALVLVACDPDDDQPTKKTAPSNILVKVKVPLVLSQPAKEGEQHYLRWCKSCHGINAGGTDKGPSLIEYERSHHSDGAFYKAVKKGVKAHHWHYGDMPALHEMSDQHIANIISYVRELQAYQDNDVER